MTALSKGLDRRRHWLCTHIERAFLEDTVMNAGERQYNPLVIEFGLNLRMT